MKYSIKYKDIIHDTERDVFIFDAKHETEDIHVEQAIVSKDEYDAVKAQIDTYLTEISEWSDTIIMIEVATPFQASTKKRRSVVSEQSYNEDTTIKEAK